MESFHFGDLHSVLIHFPIVLTFITLVFDVLYWVKKQEIFHTLASWFIMTAAVSLIPTALTGFLAKDFYPVGDPDVFRHQTMAIVTALYTIFYAVFRGYAYFNHQLFSLYLYLTLSVINVGLVNTTAEFGGIVVRGKGIFSDTLRSKGTPLPYNTISGK